jgi:SAM-dependent methyltransferase
VYQVATPGGLRPGNPRVPASPAGGARLLAPGRRMAMLREAWRSVRVRTVTLRDAVRRLGGTQRVQRSAPLLPEDRTGKRRRMHVLVDLIHERCPKAGVRVAEIGCAGGGTSVHLVRYCPQIQELVCVDLVKPGADRRAFHAEKRITFVQGYSDQVAAQFPPESFDLVFIDADHSEEWVTRDLHAWVSRVKPGGIVSGHDYGSHNYPGVKIAVDRFFAGHPHPIALDANKVWWTTKV